MTSNHSLPLRPEDPPPAYGCVIHVRAVNGGVQAKVANLEGLEVTEKNERAAMAKLVPLFRQKIAEAQSNGQALELSRTVPLEEGEVRRFLPVHL
ncbi:MAG: hypothetical protein AAF664_12530 [Planctomycetota bacterium]